MKLLLDKNFIEEKEKFTKEQEASIKYKGWTLEGEEIELVDMESTKIAPIVRYLAEGKKKKLTWLLILIAGFLLLLFFGLMVWALYPKETPPPPKNEIIKPVSEKTPEIQVTKKQTEEETSWSLDLFNEVDMVKDQKNKAELETLKLTFENNRLKIQLDEKQIQIGEKQKIIEKLTNEVNNLEDKIKLLNTRKIETPEDEFIYYLGEGVYKKCTLTPDPLMLDKCKNLYFDFLEYGKNR